MTPLNEREQAEKLARLKAAYCGVDPARPCGYCNGKGYAVIEERVPGPKDTYSIKATPTQCPVCGGKGSR